jgi:class 3 adenylate cyclase/tetratricopeptide (TPR) repeat protein
LFCDLAGSTAIAAGMDPEDWRAAVAAYHGAAAGAITRYGGHVAKYLGDGVMAFFGYPEAHDNDAERAARAGLAIIGAIARLNENGAHPKLAARIGIDSGPVVVGAGTGPGADVFGDAPNIAARVQAAADPGMVLVSSNTHRLMPGLFIVEDRGPQSLKGIGEPLQLYRVIQPSGVRGRLEAAAASRGLTPFVGREDELRLLMSRWERACEGEGQVALIIGEAGIGKSRLVHRFHEAIARTPHTWIEAGAGAFFQNTPFYPITEMLRQLGWEERLNRLGDYLRDLQADANQAGQNNGEGRDDSASGEFAQLEPRLVAAGLKPAEAMPLIAPLLHLPLPPEYQPSSLPPDQQRRRLLAILVEWVLGSARAQPLIIATEDLHWVDPSTLELIQLLVEQGAHARLLLLYTARPEFRPPWPMRAHHAQINLNRLSARDIRAMVAQVAAQKALADETVTAVVERTGGVPLFVEELTRSLLESGEAKASGHAIPATLHDSLMARLDRLRPAKEIIQIGAVLGGKFSYELLHAVHPLNGGELEGHLRTLTGAELLYARGLAPDATYQFKHALIRDAAYEALLKTRRKELHLVVARTINEKFPVIKETHPEVLARHWTEAGEIEPAIAEWTRAGKAAEFRNAFPEALESYERAITLLKGLTESAERGRDEISLQQSIASMLFMIEGHTSGEAIGATKRALALAENFGDMRQRVTSVISRSMTNLLAGDLAGAELLIGQALELANRDGNRLNLSPAYTVQIMIRYFRGDLEGSEYCFAAGLKFFGDRGVGQFPGAVSGPYCFSGYSLWTLGRIEAARHRINSALEVAKKGDPYDAALASLAAGYLNAYMRNFREAETFLISALELTERSQFGQFATAARCALGYVSAQLDHVAEGIALIRQGLAEFTQSGTILGITRDMTHLAQALSIAGEIGPASEAIGEALLVNPDERVYRPETLRIRGEIRLEQGASESAEADFREAIALAQSMSAKSWELRATMSLARLLRDTNRGAEARTMLTKIHSWFTEGFDTPDLVDAKALLGELEN